MLFITIASSTKCPTDCTCSIINENTDHEENHAKCSSLIGFKKTDDDDDNELLPPIKSLDLSNLGLTKISSQLDKLKFLSEVDLTNNSLSEFSKLNKRVKTLNLSFNQITSAKLVKIPQYVENLNLSNNEITYIPTEMMRLKNLRSLELNGNFINCSCETLQVRNWLQEQNVYTEKHISCSTPQRFKGRPWLQIRESDVCGQENDSLTSENNFWDQEEDENDIMLADSPIVSDVGSGEEESTDDLEKEYLPLGKQSIINEKLDSEGSGDDFDQAPNVRLFNDNITIQNSDDEASGSGDDSSTGVRIADEDSEEEGSGAFPIPNFPNISRMGDVIRKIINDTPSIGFDGEEKEDFVPSPIYSPSEDVTSPPSLGIFEGNVHTYKDPVSTEASKPDSDNELINVEEPIVKKVNEATVDKENIKLSNIGDENPEDNNKNAYIFLGVVGALLIVLIAFVVIKRKKHNSSARKDIENQQGKELVDMERNVLGKPAQRNGVPENSPLLIQQPYFDRIDSPKSTPYQEASPAQKSAPEPVHKSSDLNQNTQPMQSFKPVPSPRSEVDSPSRSVQPDGDLEKKNEAPIIEEPIVPIENGIHENGDDEVFNPIDNDPNSAAARYSPVYSPITGRVKIKLTETPIPKTPLLVTRSRSNAGDIITSPNLNQRSPYK